MRTYTARGKEFTFEERTLIEENLKKDFTFAHIARSINRPKTSVINEIKRNGGRSVYNAKAANERAIKFKTLRWAGKFPERYAFDNEKYRELIEVRDQIEFLKKQIEIIYDFITKENP